MTESNIFPNKCLKCKKVSEKTEKVYFSKTRGIGNNKNSVSMGFPVCEECLLGFNKYLKLKKIGNFSLKLIYFIPFLFIMYLVGTHFFPLITNLFPIVACILFLCSFPFIIISYINPFRITKFVKLKMDGTYIIKDPEYRNEMIQLYQKSIITEAHNEIYEPEGINTVFCPKCGKKYNKNTDFCLVCGKDLRLLK